MASNITAHPIFPAKTEDDEPPEVVTITVLRREGSSMQQVPRRFLAEELTDETQIAEWYGGGVYELVARNHSHITARRGLHFPGVSKPLHTDATPAATPGQAPVVQQMVSQSPTWWVPVVTALGPLVLQWMSQRADGDRRAQEAHQTLMTTMMANSQNANMQMITLLTNLKSNAPNGQEFKEGMSFMENVLAGQLEKAKTESDEGSDAQQTIAALMQAMQIAQEFSTKPGDGGNNGSTQ